MLKCSFFSTVFICLVYIQVGIIGGSGLDDPEILDERREIYRETPYGKYLKIVITLSADYDVLDMTKNFFFFFN